MLIADWWRASQEASGKSCAAVWAADELVAQGLVSLVYVWTQCMRV